ncbi:hypothetical protein FHL15_007774 [Xylaria flabelliformis]|uniref:25S rRNA (uridine-N(3))-methyltransferase BMT5-like domain-containing protein n=1 Tax=Xylaria flabelliformis TaxID=2512241 RepID=A0A553HTS2_9PEZI|nr:hypothetical protein FHL15_007774 [Xylaria flabelliformis]
MGKKRKLAQGARAKHPHSNSGTKPQQKQKQKQNPANAGSNAPPQHQHQHQHQHQQQRHAEPTIPFTPEDKILLVGDGDLSFAASLVEHHYCADVTATVFEKNREELLEKYPHAADNIAKIEAEEGCRVLFSVDATKMAPFTDKSGRSSSSSKASGSEGASSAAAGVMDRIIFNFPHVGGKSTDVNRQVRYNQELLVSFFQRAAPSLAPGGSIIVTLFEGEPYTLWNIRDLARHSGLQVERSFRFQAIAYPGYHHARTLGVVRNRSGEVGGGWKGEDRAARSYIFVKKDAESRPFDGQRGTKRSRKHDDDSSDEE